MTLVAARAAAATAIETAAGPGMLWHGRVREADSIRPEALVRYGGALPEAANPSRHRGTSGPALVVVTAPARDDAGAIMVRVFTVIRARLDLATTGGGRGLAVVDMVESALRGLPGTSLPPLEPETTLAPPPTRIQDDQTAIWVTTVLWPPSAGDAASPVPTSSLRAVREAAGTAVATVLSVDVTDTTDVNRRGQSETEIRNARWRRLLPRCEIMLALDPRGPVRAGTGRVVDGMDEFDVDLAQLLVTVTARICAAVEDDADSLALRTWAALSETRVVPPGTTQGVLLRPRDLTPATYDERAGCLVAVAEADADLYVEVGPRRPRVALADITFECVLLGQRPP